ncbi:MAG: glycosyltransferase [Oscillospiraceae bacterium]|nr:glycosyltransferase [Oscillospiraceae bacterium]
MGVCKVLFLNVVCKSGSTGKIVYDLYRHLLSNGHDAAVCYGRGKSIDEPGIFKISGKFEVSIHALLTRLTGLTSCFSPFATGRLIRFIREYEPDVVHLHNLHGYYVNMIPVIEHIKKKRIKTIWTLHDEHVYTGKCGYSYECGKWKDRCGGCPEKKEYPASLIFDCTHKMHEGKKRAFEGFDNLQIVTPSEWLAGRVRQSFLKNKEIVVVPNGIDTEVFKPSDAESLKARHGITAQKIIAYVTADFENERKGGKYVLELAKRLPDVRFFIIGNNGAIPDLPSNVTAIGRTENQQELASYYSMADINLITSKAETFSMVCAEGLCCGTPAVGFIGSATSYTAPDDYGCFVQYGDINKLEQAVTSIVSGVVKLKGSGECAAFGRIMYDSRDMAQAYYKLFKG